MANKLKALIFDVDGTLAETEEAHRRAFNSAFNKFGFTWEWSPKVYQNLLQVTGGKERMRHFVSSNFPTETEKFEKDIVELHKFKQERYAEIIRRGEIQLRPGIKRLVLEARTEHLKLAIATTSTMLSIKTLTKSLLSTDAFEWFEAKGCAETVSSRKPDPGVYNYVLDELQVLPQEAIAFEDSEIGLTAAIEAGLAAVVCPSKYLPDENYNGAMTVLSNLGEAGAPTEHLAGLSNDEEYVSINQLKIWFDQYHS